MRIVFLGLSITSSWGNGHATTYRALCRELAARGHDVLFLERDVPWYAEHRDQREFGRVTVKLYSDLDELRDRHAADVRDADAVIVGSFVPEGIAVGEWVLLTANGLTAFYDIDTPVTLAKLARGEADYISAALIRRYDCYFSFTGGPTLTRLQHDYGAPAARPLYCSVDPALYFSEPHRTKWLLGYLGTYSADRQPTLDRLLFGPARDLPDEKFVVAGAQYPRRVRWPANVEHIAHLPPAQHRRFYNSQRFTLNVTRADMIAAGYSPSVRLFEAAACGTPIISDVWDGIEAFFTPGEEILLARSLAEMRRHLLKLSPDQACEIGAAARRRVLAHHTAAHRAAELEHDLLHLRERPRRRRAIAATA